MQRFLLAILVSTSGSLSAQVAKSKAKFIEDRLKYHVTVLANDSLEGRRTGTMGEKKAQSYLITYFKELKIKGLGDNGSYTQTFSFDDGNELTPMTELYVNNVRLTPLVDFFPLGNSPSKKRESVELSPSLTEIGQPWFRDIGQILIINKDNPHFDYGEWLRSEVDSCFMKGATGLILYNSSPLTDRFMYNPKEKGPKLKLPVIYVNQKAYNKHFRDHGELYKITYAIDTRTRKREGANIVAQIDNNSDQTVIIGAHYDHLGYGEDGNSMLRTGDRVIHNGADDNASGTAMMMELAKTLKHRSFKKFNYLFIGFSGEELGLFGSKYFVDNPTIDLDKVNYMINLDMVGRLSDSTRMLTVGGYGTSSLWDDIISRTKGESIKFKFDSSGSGPSDHTSFYRKNIPVLFLFTGLHSDYHKPSDDAERINYTGMVDIKSFIEKLILSSSRYPKLDFIKTREQQTSTSARFSVSLGIMPDYSYSGAGVKVDGVSEGRPAQKAGIKIGDVILKLGQQNITSVEDYMQSLARFKKGQISDVTVSRNGNTIILTVQF